ncbi:CD209 antigen-like protein C [Mercenaria mercenaria]|uniref:CD209 antigen-like protein C n=1 Tax=Mercenaria mercenaria TaxID=6596 RepID=UPI00234F0300|nr:CD209 antigen-like protein C [Mercenaria mercenaria]
MATMWRTCFGLSLIFLYEISNDVFAIGNIRFTKYRLFDGYTCSSNQTVFNARDIGNRIMCVSMCSASPACLGVFYHQMEKRCIGCAFYMNVSAPARNGTTFYRREKYRLIEEPMNWNEAKDHCTVLGGQLATIKSLHEQMFVSELLNQADIGALVWIGASDTTAESTFVWIDGTTFSAFTYWEPGQPNNYLNQDCVELGNRNGKWLWMDSRCTDKRFSLCEFN